MTAKSANANSRQPFNLETGRHLFQPPRYTLGDGQWFDDFPTAAARCASLSWDPAALLSYLTYGYVSGDRTLFVEIRRQPWVSTIDSDQDVRLESPPVHDFFRLTPVEIGARLLKLLENEAETVCVGRSDVYILTSGGLDSRIVAGVMRRLIDQGRVKARVHAVTWGRDGSRDVEIGRIVAEKLKFPWTHLTLGPEDLRRNIDHVALELGALVSPIHLHRMMWFRDLPAGALVLGGSYGDSVGRAEFSGRNVLELLPYQANDLFGLMTQPSFAVGQATLSQDWMAFRERFQGTPDFAVRECEYQAHYMRGLIAQTMSVINGPADLYQMFTSPEVYGFMWSIHPSFRDDRPYAALLAQLENDLHQLPWARTNRSLNSRQSIKVNARFKQYYDYTNWIRNDILPEVDQPDLTQWLTETRLFKEDAIFEVFQKARESQVPFEIRQSTNVVVWLLALRKLVDSLATRPASDFAPAALESSSGATRSVSRLRRTLREIPWALSTVRAIRKRMKRKQALQQFPPKPFPPQS